MTAIKPIDNRRVVAVAAETYPINAQCAHPDCTEPSADPHHSFPRSQIGGDSYFVSITFDTYEDAVEVLGKNCAVSEVPGLGYVSAPVPHCIGLCRHHHDLVEARQAWIFLEHGEYVWCEKAENGEFEWIGPLNPQPGATKSKRKRKKLSTEERRKRINVTVRVPADKEDGAAVWDETQDRIKEKLVAMDLYDEGDEIPNYEAWIAAANDWLNTV